jgi:hypothetical protein
MNASRMPSREATTAAGSASASGIGCSQVTSGSGGASRLSGSSPGPTNPDGNERRCPRSSSRRQALVAIR